MGQSKQLLSIKGRPLLLKTVEELLAANTGEVIVVLGANAAAHKKVIAHCPVQMIENNQWQNGMGASIKTGLNFIKGQFPKAKAVIISVCDQPHLTSTHIKQITQVYSNTQKTIVAAMYKGILGVPVLFDHSHFETLTQIQDEEGAKKIIQQNLTNATSIPFPLGHIDLDTMEDYDTFNQ